MTPSVVTSETRKSESQRYFFSTLTVMKYEKTEFVFSAWFQPQKKENGIGLAKR